MGLKFGKAVTAPAEKSPVDETEVAEVVEAAEVDSDGSQTPVASYTSHPIMNYKIGEFQFMNCSLVLYSEEEANRLDALLAQSPMIVRTEIRKLDLGAAEKAAAEFMESQRTMTLGVDTTKTVAGPRV